MSLKVFAKQIIPPVTLPFAKKIYRICGKPAANKRFFSRLQKLISGNPEIEELFPAQEMKGHYVYENMRQSTEHPDLFINQVRYFRMYKFFGDNYPEVFSNNKSVIDIGDTSGILFRAMKRRGLSVNINPDVVESIKKSGIESKVGDVENLPFADKSFDYAFSFECLEHVSNPIRALCEINRITKKKVFLSVPYVETTMIYNLDYWKKLKTESLDKGGWGESSVRDVDCHKFEFSDKDFQKIVSHTPLKYCDSFPINYFKPLGSTKKSEGSYFNFFILEPG